jgi:hypothetical protein
LQRRHLRVEGHNATSPLVGRPTTKTTLKPGAFSKEPGKHIFHRDLAWRRKSSFFPPLSDSFFVRIYKKEAAAYTLEQQEQRRVRPSQTQHEAVCTRVCHLPSVQARPLLSAGQQHHCQLGQQARRLLPAGQQHHYQLGRLQGPGRATCQPLCRAFTPSSWEIQRAGQRIVATGPCLHPLPSGVSFLHPVATTTTRPTSTFGGMSISADQFKPSVSYPNMPGNVVGKKIS